MFMHGQPQIPCACLSVCEWPCLLWDPADGLFGASALKRSTHLSAVVVLRVAAESVDQRCHDRILSASQYC